MKHKKRKPNRAGRQRPNVLADNAGALERKHTGLPFVRRTTPSEPLIIRVGPLVTVQRMPEERRSRDADLHVQLGGDAVVRDMAALLARDNSPVVLASILWCFITPYASHILGLGPGIELRPLVVGPLATAIENLGAAPYEVLANRMLVRAYEQMRTELERCEASLPIIGGSRCPVVLGKYWMAREVFIREVGADACRRLELLALWGALRCMACAFLSSLAPDFRPTFALEYLLGIRESSECFLVSELDVALKRGDLDYAEQLSFDPGILNFRVDGQPLSHAPMKYRPHHVDTDESEWRIINSVGEALARSKWQDAQSPARVVVKTTWSVLAQRRNMHEQDYINAASQGCSVEQYANLDMLTDSPLDTLSRKRVKASSRRDSIALKQLGTSDGLPSGP